MIGGQIIPSVQRMRHWWGITEMMEKRSERGERREKENDNQLVDNRLFIAQVFIGVIVLTTVATSSAGTNSHSLSVRILFSKNTDALSPNSHWRLVSSSLRAPPSLRNKLHAGIFYAMRGP